MTGTESESIGAEGVGGGSRSRGQDEDEDDDEGRALEVAHSVSVGSSRGRQILRPLGMDRRPLLWCPRRGPGLLWHGVANDVRGALAFELVVDVPVGVTSAQGTEGQTAEVDLAILLRPAAEEVGEGDLPRADCELAAAGVCSRIAAPSRSGT